MARPVFARIFGRPEKIAFSKAIKLTDQWSAAFFGSLIAALHAWCMFVCHKACGGHPP